MGTNMGPTQNRTITYIENVKEAIGQKLRPMKHTINSGFQYYCDPIDEFRKIISNQHVLENNHHIYFLSIDWQIKRDLTK